MGIKRCQDLVYIFVIYQKDSKSASNSAFFYSHLKYFSKFLMLLLLALDFEAKTVMKWLQKTKNVFYKCVLGA